MASPEPEASTEQKLAICKELISQLKAENKELRRFKNRLYWRAANLFKSIDSLAAIVDYGETLDT